MHNIETKVLNRIYGYGRGACFTPDRFLDYGSDTAIRKSLSRLAKVGHIRRLAKGIYEYPQIHKELGAIPTKPESVLRRWLFETTFKCSPRGH